MNSFIIFIVLTLLSFSNAYGMSCSSWASGSMAASGSNATVAKVTTLTLDPLTKESTLKVEKVYKGDSSLQIINLPADDMGFGVRPTMEEGSWIGIFVKHEQNAYYNEIGCGVGFFSINKTGVNVGKINVQVGHASTIELSESEFEEYINSRSIPTPSSAICRVYIYSDSDDSVEHSFNDEFKVNFYDENHYVKDLRFMNPNFKELNVLTQLNPYEFYMMVIDPFLGKTKLSATYNLYESRNTFQIYSFDISSNNDEHYMNLSCFVEYDLPMLPVKY